MGRATLLIYPLLVQFVLSDPVIAQSKTAHAEVSVAQQADGACLAVIDGKPFDMKSEQAVRDALRLYPVSEADVHLVGDTDVPYRCLGGLIYTLQKLGYHKIGFISEHPPHD